MLVCVSSHHPRNYMATPTQAWVLKHLWTLATNDKYNPHGKHWTWFRFSIAMLALIETLAKKNIHMSDTTIKLLVLQRRAGLDLPNWESMWINLGRWHKWHHRTTIIWALQKHGLGMFIGYWGSYWLTNVPIEDRYCCVMDGVLGTVCTYRPWGCILWDKFCHSCFSQY
jgi:hypothetical protein